MLVDRLHRSLGGSDVVEEGYIIEAGEHVHADAVETEYIALLAESGDGGTSRAVLRHGVAGTDSIGGIL